MKLIIAGLLALALFGCSGKGIQPGDFMPLTEQEVSQALRDALSRGISVSAASASRSNGFYGNPQLRIAFPQDTDKLQNTLRKLGFGAEIDRAEMQLNRAAEQASARAKPVFIRAITGMSIDDAFDILEGERDAATRYLEDETRGELYRQFRPVVVDALRETGATRYYADVVARYNALPLVFDVDPDIAGYVTDKTIDGLFVLIAQEEARIRTISSARSTRLMKRVFGSLD